MCLRPDESTAGTLVPYWGRRRWAWTAAQAGTLIFRQSGERSPGR
jgi:hypothetical protein